MFAIHGATKICEPIRRIDMAEIQDVDAVVVRAVIGEPAASLHRGRVPWWSSPKPKSTSRPMRPTQVESRKISSVQAAPSEGPAVGHGLSHFQ